MGGGERKRILREKHKKELHAKLGAIQLQTSLDNTLDAVTGSTAGKSMCGSRKLENIHQIQKGSNLFNKTQSICPGA